MNDFLFSLNATMPVFLVMLLGFLFHRIGWIDDLFAARLNKFVFLVPLPVMLFRQLGSTDFASAWDGFFLLFCLGTTFFSIVIAFVLSLRMRRVSERGEFIQAAYRSSAAILGIAYITNIYGDAGMAPLMILGAVPLYNICAVVVLTLTAPENSSHPDGALLGRTALGVLKNPIILGVFAGFAWSLLGLPMGGIFDKTLSSLSALATPLGLLALGASIVPEKVGGSLKSSLLAVAVKLLGLAAVFLPAAAALGFRNEKLVAILIMLGSPSTVSCFVMARNMGHEGTLTSNAVVLSTVLSTFTLTFWIYLLRHLGLI